MPSYPPSQKAEAVLRLKMLRVNPSLVSAFEQMDEKFMSMSKSMCRCDSTTRNIVSQWEAATGNIVYMVFQSVYSVCNDTRFAFLYVSPEKGSWLQSRDDLLCGKPEAYIWVTSNPELCDYMQIQIAHRGDVVIRLK